MPWSQDGMTQPFPVQDEAQGCWHELPTDVLVLAFSCPGLQQRHLYKSLSLVCRGWRKAALAACKQQLLLVLDGHRLQPWSAWVQRHPGCLRSLSIRCWRVLGHQAEAQALGFLTSALCSMKNLQQLSLEHFPVVAFPTSLTQLKLHGLHIPPMPRHQQQLEGLGSLQQLQHLFISGVTPRLPHAALLALTPLRHLTHLTLSSCELSNDSPLHSLPTQLKSLALSYHPDLDTLPSLAQLPHLEELVLDHLGYPLQLPLADVAALSGLRHLSLAKAASAAPVYIPADSAVHLSTAGARAMLVPGSGTSSSVGAAGNVAHQDQHLQQQQAAGGGWTSSSSSSSSLEDWVWHWCAGLLTGLTSLRLEGYRISVAALQASSLPHLQHLSLGPLDLAAVDALASTCPHLTSCHLTLAPPQPRTLQQLQLVDPRGVASLAQLQSLRELSLVSAPKNQLSALRVLSQMTWLQVDNLETGAAAAAVQQVAPLTRLRHLRLLGDGVKGGGVVQLCGALQQLTELRLQLRETQFTAELEAVMASMAVPVGKHNSLTTAHAATAAAPPPPAEAATTAGSGPSALLARLQQLRHLQRLDLGLAPVQHKLLAAALQLPELDEVKL